MVLSCPPPSQPARVLGAFDSAVPSVSCEFTTTLIRGMNSLEVQCLQKLLNAKGFSLAGVKSGTETTYFGEATFQSLQAFQTANNLVADGIAGSKTFKVLLGY